MLVVGNDRRHVHTKSHYSVGHPEWVCHGALVSQTTHKCCKCSRFFFKAQRDEYRSCYVRPWKRFEKNVTRDMGLHKIDVLRASIMRWNENLQSPKICMKLSPKMSNSSAENTCDLVNRLWNLANRLFMYILSKNSFYRFNLIIFSISTLYM